MRINIRRLLLRGSCTPTLTQDGQMIIRNVTVRRGTALLEPQCIELKGHRTADRDEKREETLFRTLKRRIGYAPSICSTLTMR